MCTLYVRRTDRHEIVTLTTDITRDSNDTGADHGTHDDNLTKQNEDVHSSTHMLSLHLQLPLSLVAAASASSSKSLSTLPPEIILDTLLPLLTPTELCMLAQTCRTFYTYCIDDSVWCIVAQRLNWLLHAQRAVHENHEYTSIRLYCIDRQRFTVTLAELWQRIYEKLDVENQRSMRPVTGKNRQHIEECIKQLESIVHHQLPLSYTLSLLNHYDGQEEYVIRGRGVVYGCRLLYIDEIITMKRSGTLWKNSDLIPITDEAGLIRYALNQRGEVYQVMGLHMHDIQYRAKNWYAFLMQLLDPHNRL